MPASLCARRASARVSAARVRARVPAYVDSERFLGWRILDERFHALDKRIALGDVEVRPILKRRVALTFVRNEHTARAQPQPFRFMRGGAMELRVWHMAWSWLSRLTTCSAACLARVESVVADSLVPEPQCCS